MPLLKLPDCGVPRIGVVKLGDVASATTVPEPVVVYDVPQAVPVEFGMPAPGYVMGTVLVIVKLGYVPDVLMPVPPVNTTVWSGAELLMVIAAEPSYVVPALYEIPVPAVRALATLPAWPLMLPDTLLPAIDVIHVGSAYEPVV